MMLPVSSKINYVRRYRFTEAENVGFETSVYLTYMAAARSGHHHHQHHQEEVAPDTMFFLQANPLDHINTPEHK